MKKKKLPLWAMKALERDNYLCRECKLPKTNIVVHHLDESRKLGYNHMNNELSNLITLCKECHALRHGFTAIDKYNYIKKLLSEGKNGQDIANVIGISRQRVWQIIKTHAPYAPFVPI